jgi:hypothetical protein
MEPDPVDLRASVSLRSLMLPLGISSFGLGPNVDRNNIESIGFDDHALDHFSR